MNRRAGSLLLLAAMVACAAASAHGLDASGSTNGRALVGADSLVNVIWRVDLGPTRVLSITSAVGEFEGAAQGTFGIQLRLTNAVGTITFPETVRIPASAALAAFESGAPILLRRRFDVARQIGPPESAEATVPVTVPSPVITLDVSPPSHQISICDPGSLTIRWTVEVDDVAPLEVASTEGALIAGGTSVARLGGRISGVAVDRLTLMEEVTVPTALFPALGLDTLDYRRSFVVRGGGLERSLDASVSIDARDADAEVGLGVTATPPALESDRPATVSLRWIAEAATPCLELVSPEVQVETSDGRVVATLPQPLQLNTLGAEVVESVNLSLAVTQRLLDLGEPAVILARSFRIASHEPLGLPSSGLRRSVRIPWRPGLASPLEILRLALTFDDGEVFRRVTPGAALGAVAEITTSGRGPIRGVWELADPASAPLSSPGPAIFRPLLVVSRPAALRGSTRITLPNLPTDTIGPHVLRFRLTSPEPDFDLPMILYQVAADWRLPVPDEPVNSGLGPPPEAAVLEASDPLEEREVLVLSAGIEKARAVETLGLEVKMRYQLETRWPDEAGERLVLTVLRTPAGVSVGDVLHQLRFHHPYLWVDANDLYAPQERVGLPREVPEEAADWNTRLKACRDAGATGEDLPATGQLSEEADLPALDPDKCSLVDAGGHSTALVNTLKAVLAKASDCAGSSTAQRSGGFLAETLSALDVALQIDQLIDNRSKEQTSEPVDKHFVMIGVAGRSNWILRILLIQHESRAFFFAPYDNNCRRRLSFPATSELVAGAVSVDEKGRVRCASNQDRDILAGDSTAFAVDISRGHSYAVPVVAAAFFALGHDTGWSPDTGLRKFQCPTRGRS